MGFLKQHWWKIILAIILIISCAYLYKSVFNKDENQLNNNLLQSPQASNNSSKQYYKYCKPDEDADFKLSKEDDFYYYYTGNKIIEGYIYQKNDSSPITFLPNGLGGGCYFQLTKGFDQSIEPAKIDFDTEQAWKNRPVCAEGTRGLEGDYAIMIKGFKISKSYIQNYQENIGIDRIAMSRFSFFANYDAITSIIEKTHVICNIRV